MKSLEHKDWREGAMCKIEKGPGRGCCCPVAAVSRTPQRDQTSGGLEVVAGKKRLEQVVVASQQWQAFHERPMDSKYEAQKVALVSKQALQQAWSHTCSVLDSGPELVEQENNASSLMELAAALARNGQ